MLLVAIGVATSLLAYGLEFLTQRAEFLVEFSVPGSKFLLRFSAVVTGLCSDLFLQLSSDPIPFLLGILSDIFKLLSVPFSAAVGDVTEADQLSCHRVIGLSVGDQATGCFLLNLLRAGNRLVSLCTEFNELGRSSSARDLPEGFITFQDSKPG